MWTNRGTEGERCEKNLSCGIDKCYNIHFYILFQETWIFILLPSTGGQFGNILFFWWWKLTTWRCVTSVGSPCIRQKDRCFVPAKPLPISLDHSTAKNSTASVALFSACMPGVFSSREIIVDDSAVGRSTSF
jgi:hypothetical protein